MPDMPDEPDLIHPEEEGGSTTVSVESGTEEGVELTETEPPPAVTVKVTGRFGMGFPFSSRIFTEGAWETAVPTVALCPDPDTALMVVGTGGEPESQAAMRTRRPMPPQAVCGEGRVRGMPGLWGKSRKVSAQR